MGQRSFRLWIGTGAVMLTALVWGTAAMVLADEQTLTATIPYYAHRWLIVDLSYHRLEWSDDQSDARTIREFRLRAGTEDTSTDTYQQYTDLTIPVWPLLPTDN